MSTYLVECMLNNHLPVGVRYAGKQVPYGSVGLLVNVLLPLGDGLRLAWHNGGGGVLIISEGCACLLHNCLPYVVASAVEVKTEALGKITLG